MGGGPFYMSCPAVLAVELKGRLPEWVAPKDVILKLLSILTTRGNVGAVVEYFGEGVSSIPVPGRATITNMGAELGVTTSIFPADEMTRAFLAAQGRGGQFTPLAADADAAYARITKRVHPEREAAVLENIRRHCPNAEVGRADAEGLVAVSFGRVVIDLSELEPLAAAPGSPENIVRLKDLVGRKVDQVVIGSCTNSSYRDLMLCAAVLKGRKLPAGVELGIAPGSRQVLTMLAGNGALADLVAAGARILECACGPCIGQGFSPGDGRVSVRTFNRNFSGRSGTAGDQVYLVSPETAVAAAIAGEFVDPRQLGIDYPEIAEADRFPADDSMIVAPPASGAGVEVIRPPTIVKPPAGTPLPDAIGCEVLIKVGDKVTTDEIMPAGALLKLRSNVPEYAKHLFGPLNKPGEPTFAERALAARDAGRAGAIVAGDSYGQGSSREHAALCPMYLGVRVVIAKALERIHQVNLVNFAILPLTFLDPADYGRIEPGDELRIAGVSAAVASAEEIKISNVTKGVDLSCRIHLSARQRKILAAGGLLNYTRGGGQ